MFSAGYCIRVKKNQSFLAESFRVSFRF